MRNMRVEAYVKGHTLVIRIHPTEIRGPLNMDNARRFPRQEGVRISAQVAESFIRSVSVAVEKALCEMGGGGTVTVLKEVK